ncbi:MAG: IS200/IS605 family element transposase accessory protein TnpB, partial [archaeon]|nr:IS200/IS605 family element transposase accessory protein TnpB [archaeon]
NNCKGVRIVPYSDRYIFEIIYEKKSENLGLDKNRIVGIDLGVTNLVTMSNNFDRTSLIIKGGIAKSINQYYNKKLADYKSKAKKINKKEITNRILRLHRKRNNKIDDIFHKISRTTINYCIKNNIGTIIIGYNEGWKQNCNIGTKNNQNFIQLPFLKLIRKIEYKAELVGIEVKLETEEYTSQTCSNCGCESMNNRKHRGLYVCSDCGLVMNADINASRNIIKKGFPESYRIGDRGGLNPPLCITV